MPRSSRKPSVERTKRASPLNVESIVEAGLRLARGEGIETLTMRAVAMELGVSTMALYYHVPDKESLLDRMRERLLSAVPTPEPRARDWEAQMKAYALASIDQLASYPGLLLYGLTRPPTKTDLNLVRHGIAILLAAGFDERAAALAISAYHTHIVGKLVVHSMREDRRKDARAQLAAKGPPDPVARVGQHLREMDFLESIEYGLDVMLAGLRLQLTTARSKATPRRV